MQLPPRWSCRICGESRPVGSVCDPLSHFQNHAFLEKQSIYPGGWPNEVGPKAARSNIGVICWYGFIRPRIGEVRTQNTVASLPKPETIVGVATQPDANCNRLFFRSLVNIAFTVPKGMVVCFAILLAPKSFSRFSVRTWRIVVSGSDGLPSRLPFNRADLNPAKVRSDILAVSCFAIVANIESITS